MDEGIAVIERPRHANQTPPAVTKLRQNDFLQLLSLTGQFRQSCLKLGIENAMPYKWAKQSEAFRKRLDEARAAGEKVLLDRYEEIIDQRVETGQIDPQSAVLTMFRTKRLDPRYRDNAVVNVNAVGPVAIQFNLSPSTPNDTKELA